MQIVGESVKKFYSEVMQDLHPRSYVDPVKVARNDLSLFAQNEIEKKAKENLVEQPGGVDMKPSEDSEVLKGRNRRIVVIGHFLTKLKMLSLFPFRHFH